MRMFSNTTAALCTAMAVLLQANLAVAQEAPPPSPNPNDLWPRSVDMAINAGTGPEVNSNDVQDVLVDMYNAGGDALQGGQTGRVTVYDYGYGGVPPVNLLVRLGNQLPVQAGWFDGARPDQYWLRVGYTLEAAENRANFRNGDWIAGGHIDFGVNFDLRAEETDQFNRDPNLRRWNEGDVRNAAYRECIRPHPNICPRNN